MDTKTFICNCLRLYPGAIHKIDEIISNFALCEDIVLSEDVIIESIQENPRNTGNIIIRKLYDWIIMNACELFKGANINEDMFDYDLEDYASNIYFNETKVFSLEHLTELIFLHQQEITPSDIALLRKYPSIVPTEDVYKKLCQYANVLINCYDFDAKEFCKHWNGQEWLTFIGKDTQKRFFVYAGYYENYISVKPMYAPHVYSNNFPTIDEAIAYAESFEDTVIYCENVKDDLPTFFAKEIEEKNEFYNF